jgi:cyclophilin family peptidyl-prolyl cis-trans isomerase
VKSKAIKITLSILAVAVVGTAIYYISLKNLPVQDGTGSAIMSNNVPKGEESIVKNNMHTVTIKTNYGEIKFTTYDADAPKAVNNFITLANKNFYDGVIFHRIIGSFMIQGGDPTGTGRGGPGYAFEDELNLYTDSYKAGYKKGVVAMANAGPNTNGSQFFIMLDDYQSDSMDIPKYLPKDYTIFGKVVSGQDIVDEIGRVATDVNNRPIKPVVMEKVTVE